MALGACGRLDLLFTDAADVRRVASRDDLFFGATSVIAFIHTQVCANGRGIGPRNRGIIQGTFHQIFVMDIGTINCQPQRDASAIG